MSETPKLRPLARVQKDATLATTEQQDQYYLVYSDGRRKKLSSTEAVLLYSKVRQEGDGNLLWKRSAEKKDKKEKKEKEPHTSPATKWRDDMRKMLALPPYEEEEESDQTAPGKG